MARARCLIASPLLLLPLLALTTGPAAAETVYSIVADGPTAGTTSSAIGSAVLTVNDDGTEAAYQISFSGLEGFETGAHFHNAEPGDSGPRLHTLLLGSPKIGVWPLEPFDLAELAAGRVYLNIHSDVHPTGEIRGNFTGGTVATGTPSWGAVKALFR